MAEPLCPKCGGDRFESINVEVDNITVGILSIHCAGCGAMVGVIEEESVSEAIGARLDQTDAAVADLKNRLSRLSRELDIALEILQGLKKSASRR
jgi:hypothetical protein